MDEYALAPNNPYAMEADPYQKGVQFFQVRRETKKKSTEKCVTIFARTGDLLRPFLLWKLLSPGTKSMALLGICWERLIKRFVRDLFWFVDSIIFFYYYFAKRETRIGKQLPLFKEQQAAIRQIYWDLLIKLFRE